ncbi:MAG TPA: hypothetical protein VKY59_15580 [Spirillospora sp.]|nr:hypothetical protein [Spirillospora sp.]
MMLNERTAYTLPSHVRGIRVISGKAWVTLGREDVVVGTQETFYLRPNRHGTVITALGRGHLEFDLIA